MTEKEKFALKLTLNGVIRSAKRSTTEFFDSLDMLLAPIEAFDKDIQQQFIDLFHEVGVKE